MASVIDGAPSGDDCEVRHTWFGGFLIRVAGPEGNAPAPKQFVPPPGQLPKTIIEVTTLLTETRVMGAIQTLTTALEVDRALAIGVGRPAAPLLLHNTV